MPIGGVSPRLAFPILSAPAAFSSSSNTLRFPQRRGRASGSLAVAAIKKLSEVSPVPIPQEPTQSLLDEDTLLPKPVVYGVYDPAGELQFVGISRNVRARVEGHRRKVPANLLRLRQVVVPARTELERTGGTLEVRVLSQVEFGTTIHVIRI